MFQSNDVKKKKKRLDTPMSIHFVFLPKSPVLLFNQLIPSTFR